MNPSMWDRRVHENDMYYVWSSAMHHCWPPWPTTVFGPHQISCLPIYCIQTDQFCMNWQCTNSFVCWLLLRNSVTLLDCMHCFLYCFFTIPMIVVRSIAISDCVSVCMSVCLHSQKRKLHQIFCACCLWPQFSPPLMTIQYIMYFWFSGRHIHTVGASKRWYHIHIHTHTRTQSFYGFYRVSQYQKGKTRKVKPI